ncbi:MAG TPA: hypothetical protein VFM58_22030 [Solirubrobacteraceae bacterium]|nr:hypothetical protein [Solirubrobacteraceae bacterium]
MLVIGGLDAPRRTRRRARRADPAPAEVETTRVTVIDAAALGDLDSADAWLSRAAVERAISTEALAVANLAVAAHRLASGDPWLPDAALSRALVWRVGYGTGEQVADGDWESARELPLPKPKRSMFSPEERVAAVLGGREVALACEELALRARGDLEHGRVREAALQLSVALEAALAELEVWRATLAPRLDELAGHREPVARAAAAALQGGLDAEAVAVVESALGRLEAALRARTTAP